MGQAHQSRIVRVTRAGRDRDLGGAGSVLVRAPGRQVQPGRHWLAAQIDPAGFGARPADGDELGAVLRPEPAADDPAIGGR